MVSPSNEPPLTLEQLHKLFAVVRLIMDQGDGEGTVEIVIKHGQVKFLRPAPSLNIIDPARVATWDQIERLFSSRPR